MIHEELYRLVGVIIWWMLMANALGYICSGRLYDAICASVIAAVIAVYLPAK